MILAYKDIENAMADGDIIITPYDADSMGTNSYDVHLARKLVTYHVPRCSTVILDCKQKPETFNYIIPDEGLVLWPGTLYLAATQEYTETRKHVPYLDGKSSIGRLGIFIHTTAGRGDIGFCGHWTMEISVIHPVRVYAGMPIGQLTFHASSSQPEIDYANKKSQKYTAYFRSEDPIPTASRMYLNFKDK